MCQLARGRFNRYGHSLCLRAPLNPFMSLTLLLNCDSVKREHIRKKKTKQKQPLTLELARRYQDVKNNSFQSVPERLDPAEKHQMKQQKARALSSAEARWNSAPRSGVSGQSGVRGLARPDAAAFSSPPCPETRPPIGKIWQ